MLSAPNFFTFLLSLTGDFKSQIPVKLDATSSPIALQGWCVNGSKTWVDFNGDSRPDLACFRNGAHSVLINDGDAFVSLTGDLESMLLYRVNSTSIAPLDTWCLNSEVVYIDFNADGLTDLACSVSATGTHHVLLNIGNGTMGHILPGAANSILMGLNNWCPDNPTYWLDFNGDGRPDLVCGTHVGSYHVLLNMNTSMNPIVGTTNNSQVLLQLTCVGPLTDVGWCPSPFPRFWVYFDGDNKIDLVCASDRGFHVLFNHDKTFLSLEPPATLDSKLQMRLQKSSNLVDLGWCSNAIWIDFNNDGREDLICQMAGNYSVFLNNGGDSLLSLTGESQSLLEYKLTREGNLQILQNWCLDGQSMWVDYNNDRFPDLVCAGLEGTHSVLINERGLSMLSISGLASSQLEMKLGPLLPSLPLTAWCVSGKSLWIDWNTDGRKDMICMASNGMIQVLLNKMPEPLTYLTSLMGDMDSRLPLKLTNTSDPIELNNWCVPGVGIQSWVDFNGDGRPDLVCSETVGMHYVLLNNGDSFLSVNGDAKGQLKYKLNSTADPILLVDWCANYRTYWTDFNGDGKVDLICHAPIYGSHYVLFNLGDTLLVIPDNNPSTLIRYQISAEPPAELINWCLEDEGRGLHGLVTWMDINNDGRSDPLCYGSPAHHALLNDGMIVHTIVQNLNSHIGQFAKCGDPMLAPDIFCPAPHRSSWMDFDGDGRLDIVCDTTDGAHHAYLNYNGGINVIAVLPGTTQLPWKATLDSAGITPLDGWCAVAVGVVVNWVDFNGDGRPDMACHSNTGHHLMLNLGTAFLSLTGEIGSQLQYRVAPGSTPQNLGSWCKPTGQLFWTDWNGDGLPDLICNSGGNHSVLLNDKGRSLMSLTGTGNNLLQVKVNTSETPVPLVDWCKPPHTTTWIDFNNDGTQDLVCSSSHGSYHVLLNLRPPAPVYTYSPTSAPTDTELPTGSPHTHSPTRAPTTVQPNAVRTVYSNESNVTVINATGGIQVTVTRDPVFGEQGIVEVAVSDPSETTASSRVSIVFYDLNNAPKDITNLLSPIVFIIPLVTGAVDAIAMCLKKEPLEVTPACHWFDPIDGVWKDSGCTTRSLPGRMVECSCSHLTIFALVFPAFNRVPTSQLLELTPDNIATYPGGIILIMTVLGLFVIMLPCAVRRDKKNRLSPDAQKEKFARWDQMEERIASYSASTRWMKRFKAELQMRHTLASFLWRKSGTSFTSVDRAFVTLFTMFVLMSLSARFHDRNTTFIGRGLVLIYTVLASLLPTTLLMHLFTHTGPRGLYEEWQIRNNLITSRFRCLDYRFPAWCRWLWYATVLGCVLAMLVYILAIALMFDQNPNYYCRGGATGEWVIDFVVPYIIATFIIEPSKIMFLVSTRHALKTMTGTMATTAISRREMELDTATVEND